MPSPAIPYKVPGYSKQLRLRLQTHDIRRGCCFPDLHIHTQATTPMPRLLLTQNMVTAAAATPTDTRPLPVHSPPHATTAAPVLLSRSPQPYRRGYRPPERPPRSQGGSESGTEADDELTRRLPAPSGRFRTDEEDNDTWIRRRRAPPPARRRGRGRLVAAVTRRVIEGLLLAVLAAVVLVGRGGRGWRLVESRRKGSAAQAALRKPC